MRKIILISLVFFSAFVKAQVTVDPETFPQVSGAISDKYLYTNTGGEGKIKVKTIWDSVTILDTTSIAYSDFYTLISGGNLEVGKTYILVDFQTIYDQMDFDNTGVLKSSLTTKTGAIEEIWVYALANDRIASTAYSKTYPNDRIQYDWTYNTTLVNGTPAKGRISERIDEWNNRTDYDHREIKFIRYDDGNGNFVQINDSGRTSQEFLTFGSNYGTGGAIYDNWLGDFYSIGMLFGQEYGNNVFNGGAVLSNRFGTITYNNTCLSDFYMNNISGGFTNCTMYQNVAYCTFSGEIRNIKSTNNILNCKFTSYFQNVDINGYILNSTFDGNIDGVVFNGQINSSYLGGTIQSTILSQITTSNFSSHIQSTSFLGNMQSVLISGDINNATFNNSLVHTQINGSIYNSSFLKELINVSLLGNINSCVFTSSNPISYLTINSEIDGKTIDEATYPFLFGTNYYKTIFQASDGNVYARYFDGTNDINVLIP